MVQLQIEIEGLAQTEWISATTEWVSASFQLQTHSNQPTAREFLEVRLLRASGCLEFMMQETVTDAFSAGCTYSGE